MNFSGFIGGSYVAPANCVDAERCVNLYVEKVESGNGKSPAALVGTPGLALFASLPEAPVRAQYEINGRLFAVTATQLFEVYSGGGYTMRGTLAPGATVSIESNGKQLLIVSSGLGFLFDLTANTLTPLAAAWAAAGFSNAAQVVEFDGYFILFESGSQEFFISNLYDGTAWQALNYALAQGGPDNIVALICNQRELWIFGSYRAELYYDSGAAAFPLSRNNNVYVESGCVAPGTLTKFANSIAWLGRDKVGQGVVYVMNGYTPERISNHAVEQAIQSYARIDDATAYAFQWFGHLFYRLDFPSADKTWVFDKSTGIWHELAYWDTSASTGGKYKAHLGRCHAFAFGKHLVGDYLSGNLYWLNPHTYTDNGVAIRRERTTPHVADGGKRLFYSRLQLDMQVGVGLDKGAVPGSDPQVMLQLSNDGGFTWSSELWASIGAIGASFTRVIWRRLGQSRDRVFRFVITDPVPVTLIAAYLDVTEGQS